MISKETIEHIAKLARIKLSEKEKGKFSEELSSILDYVDKLNKADTNNIEPINQVTGLNNVFRNDIGRQTDSEIRNKIIKQAPEKKGNYYKVPKILE